MRSTDLLSLVLLGKGSTDLLLVEAQITSTNCASWKEKKNHDLFCFHEKQIFASRGSIDLYLVVAQIFITWNR